MGAEHDEEEDGWSHAGFLPFCPSCRGVVGDVEKHALRDLKSDYLFRNANPTPSTKMLRVRGFFEFPATLGYAP